jgi:phospholipase/carboxylesterase
VKAISGILHGGIAIAKASKAMIMLHGRGGTAEGILGVAEELCGNDFYIAAPQAENQVWYPYSFLEEEKKNEPYLSQSIESIKDLIDQTARHISQEHIFIAGFSQGACLALEVTARYAAKYGGIVAFTGGLIGRILDEKKYQGDFKETKVFISNGDHDPHIPLERSEASKRIFEGLGAAVALKIYSGRPHTIIEDEIAFVKQHILGRNSTP